MLTTLRHSISYLDLLKLTREVLIQNYLDFFSFFAYSKNKNLSAYDNFLEILKINFEIN